MGRYLLLCFLLLNCVFSQFGCTSIQAKVPEGLTLTSAVWEIKPPKASFFNTKGQFFSAGPYKTSDVEQGVFTDVAVELDWSKSSAEKGGEKEWLSFTIAKGRKTFAWVACQFSFNGVTYKEKNSAATYGVTDRSCEIKTNKEGFRFKAYKGDLSASELTGDKKTYRLAFSNKVLPDKTVATKTGVEISSEQKNPKLLAWIKTLADGDPSKIYLAETLSAKEEEAAVAIGMSYLVMDHFLCGKSC